MFQVKEMHSTGVSAASSRLGLNACFHSLNKDVVIPFFLFRNYVLYFLISGAIGCCSISFFVVVFG